MNNSIIKLPRAYNEPVKQYMPGSIERQLLLSELNRQMGSGKYPPDHQRAGDQNHGF